MSALKIKRVGQVRDEKTEQNAPFLCFYRGYNLFLGQTLIQTPHTLPLPMSWKCSFIYCEHFSGSKLRLPSAVGFSPKIAPAGQAFLQIWHSPHPFSMTGNSLCKGALVKMVARRTLLPKSVDKNSPLLPTKPSPDKTAAVLCAITPR